MTNPTQPKLLELPVLPYDGIFTGTPKSTGELLLRKCLKLAGLNVTTEHIMMAQQGDVMKAFLEQESDHSTVSVGPQYLHGQGKVPRSSCQGFLFGQKRRLSNL
jgi:hypothetical protein